MKAKTLTLSVAGLTLCLVGVAPAAPAREADRPDDRQRTTERDTKRPEPPRDTRPDNGRTPQRPDQHAQPPRPTPRPDEHAQPPRPTPRPDEHAQPPRPTPRPDEHGRPPLAPPPHVDHDRWDGRRIEVRVRSRYEGSTRLVPALGTFEQLGCRVYWLAERQTATFLAGDRTVIVRAWDPWASVIDGGREYRLPLETRPVMAGPELFVPFESVCRALGLSVTSYGSTYHVGPRHAVICW